MRKFTWLIAMAFVVCLASPVAVGNEIGSDDRVPSPSLDRPGPGPDRPSPLPPPTGPSQPTASEELQLVGFTAQAFPGNLGILNYALACQELFPNSRMCTMQEVNRTLRVPAPVIGPTHAWVRDATAPPPANCNAWTSGASSHLGMAIGLGSSYGGCGLFGCDSLFAVACCAPHEE